MIEKQMHRPLSEGALLPSGLEQANLRALDAEGMPCFFWSTGRFCFEVNFYLLGLWRDGRVSLSNKGGTARRYAMQISHLIRFLELNRISITTISDSYFEFFIKGLCSEVNADGGLVRVPNTVRDIGSRCLDFLSVMSEEFGFHGYVSKTGVVRGYKIEVRQRRERNSQFRKIAWYHPSFPLSSSDDRRSPIAPSDISALRLAARSRPPLVAARLKTLISVLINTGCRRAEAARIKVEDIMKAFRSKVSHPLLRIPSVKGDRGFRVLPVPHVVIDSWVSYIEGDRLDLIEKRRSVDSDFVDHGFLFLNAISADPIAIDTITNDISDLRKMAGLTSRAHPHMFRHRFITEKFKDLIVKYDLENTDVMRRAIANADVIKRVLQEWTGHKLVESLDHYIHIAFRELARMEKVVDATLAQAAASDLLRQLDDFESEFRLNLLSEDEFNRMSLKTVREYYRFHAKR
ncbi:tyrosine-type recombinase/integrase [Pseudomonas sp. PA1(2017)]|uniref:tyrosine-type recombinase/integrase n=1 Tax=Pseudomonas sp. PA1(2017) TaxID=1932113 RepID=UPI00111513D7|nr:tyrosine-type recombinase/integrase [Pseudomonas sp. PA1(2017)]